MQVANPHQGHQPTGDWTSTLQNLINSPNQLQRLMHALAAQQNQPMPPVAPPDFDPHAMAMDPRAAQHQITSYEPNTYDFSRFRTDLPAPAPGPGAQSAALAPSLLGSLSQKDDEGPSLEPLVENANRLQKTYHDASEIDADVDALQYNLNSLINGLGLDPSTLNAVTRTPDDGASDSIPAPTEGLSGDPSADFDFDAFLNELSTRNGVDAGFSDVTTQFDPSTPLDGTTVGDASTDQLTAFLDDVSSPHAAALDGQALPKSVVGTKRKSDVADLPPPLVSHDPAFAPKIKRKR